MLRVGKSRIAEMRLLETAHARAQGEHAAGERLIGEVHARGPDRRTRGRWRRSSSSCPRRLRRRRGLRGACSCRRTGGGSQVLPSRRHSRSADQLHERMRIGQIHCAAVGTECQAVGNDEAAEDAFKAATSIVTIQAAHARGERHVDCHRSGPEPTLPIAPAVVEMRAVCAARRRRGMTLIAGASSFGDVMALLQIPANVTVLRGHVRGADAGDVRADRLAVAAALPKL